ncbi:MAG TPA: fused MFS/spermidine synthase [Candidatus Acidoferrum sp.]|nr:fused MFS/spermidine synthase [Candidatus Acidoferrum sp.]
MERFFHWKILLEIKESDIVVVKRDGDTAVLSHGIVYSRLMDGSLYTQSYWDYLFPLAALHKHSDVLMLGLGGGTVPYQMNCVFGKNAKIDAVELDKNMVRAIDAFLPKKLDAKIIVGDAYSYMRNCRKKYDVIILDIFKKMEVPAEFLTSEFIGMVYNALKSDGVLGMNYISNQLIMKEHLLKSKLRKRFKVMTIKEPRAFGNHIFICSKSLNKDEILSRIAQNFKLNGENAFIIDAYQKME